MQADGAPSSGPPKLLIGHDSLEKCAKRRRNRLRDESTSRIGAGASYVRGVGEPAQLAGNRANKSIVNPHKALRPRDNCGRKR